MSSDNRLQNALSPAFLAASIDVKTSAYLVGRIGDTVVRWARRHGIGRQLHAHAPWRIDPVGLAIVNAGDSEALDAYKRREISNPALARYIEASRQATAFPARGTG